MINLSCPIYCVTIILVQIIFVLIFLILIYFVKYFLSKNILSSVLCPIYCVSVYFVLLPNDGTQQVTHDHSVLYWILNDGSANFFVSFNNAIFRTVLRRASTENVFLSVNRWHNAKCFEKSVDGIASFEHWCCL